MNFVLQARSVDFGLQHRIHANNRKSNRMGKQILHHARESELSSSFVSIQLAPRLSPGMTQPYARIIYTSQFC